MCTYNLMGTCDLLMIGSPISPLYCDLFYTINFGTSMTSVVRIFLFIIFAMFLLIPNNSVRISIYIYYSYIPTQAIAVIRSTTYKLTLYCNSNVICII